jgi:hypothetical protein
MSKTNLPPKQIEVIFHSFSLVQVVYSAPFVISYFHRIIYKYDMMIYLNLFLFVLSVYLKKLYCMNSYVTYKLNIFL